MSSLPFRRAHLPVFHTPSIVCVLSPVMCWETISKFKGLSRCPLTEGQCILYLMESCMYWATMFPVVENKYFIGPDLSFTYWIINICTVREVQTLQGGSPIRNTLEHPYYLPITCLRSSLSIPRHQPSREHTASPPHIIILPWPLPLTGLDLLVVF